MRNPRREARASASLPGDADDLTPKPLTRQVKWQIKHPLKRWAHRALESALNRKLIERQPCAVCGFEKVDGHHSDYSRPLDVIWLCRKHHIAVHREANDG